MKTYYNSFLFLLFLIPYIGLSQSIITGTVIDEANGAPIPGVNVSVKNTSKGTSTDFNGKYTITVSNGDVIVFSYLGYKTEEIAYNGQSPLDISLSEDASVLDEVIVVGYGTTTVKSSTGALTAVKAEDFNKGNITTPENLLNGRVAGLTINTSGAPGSGSEIRIRGGASLNATNEPLIIIDGLPIDRNAVGGSRSILSTIDPNNIESFTVLKDAASTSVYGSRASNGVIIITTKKGTQELQVTFNTQIGINTVADVIDVFSADEFRALIAERFPDQVGLLGNANTDFQEEIYQEELFIDNNLSVRGTLFGAIPTRASVRYTNRPGLRETSSFESSAFSLRLTPSLFDDHLKVNVNSNLTFETNRFTDGVEGGALRFDPTQPVTLPSAGNFIAFNEFTDANGTPAPFVPRNPVAQLLQNRNISNARRFYGNIDLDYKLHFFPDLRAKVSLGYDRSNALGFNERDLGSPLGVQENVNGQTLFLGSNSRFTDLITNVQFNAQLQYTKTFGDFNVNAQAIYNFQQFERESFTTNELNDPTPAIGPEFNIGTDIVLLTYIGRGEVSYKDKYFLSASITRDGTSRFAPSERFGNFPSVSAAWSLSDDLFPNSNVINNIKLRASYGITGQQDIGQESLFLSRFVLGEDNSQFIFGNTPITVAQGQFRNESLRWEQTTQINVGVDYSLFNNRINGSIEVYRNESDDLLAQVPIADGSNFGNFGVQNIGVLSAQGVEFTINADIIQNDNFNWNVNFNAAFLDREIDELFAGADVEVGGIAGGTGGNIQIFREGFAPNSFFVFRQLFDQFGRPIEGAFADINGDGIVNDENDRTIFGNPDPDVTLGFSSNFTYKRFDLAFFLRASIGNEIYNNVNSANAQFGQVFTNGVLNNVPRSVLDTEFNVTDDVIRSNIFVEDGSFLRLDNITFGYTAPLKNAGTSLRIYGAAQNVFLITDYSGLDPEVGTSGIDNTIFPRARTFILGFNYNF